MKISTEGAESGGAAAAEVDAVWPTEAEGGFEAVTLEWAEGVSVLAWDIVLFVGLSFVDEDLKELPDGGPS